MCSSFYPSDSCVCLLRCPCLLVLCSDLLTQPLLTLFSLLTNPSPAELWAPPGGWSSLLLASRCPGTGLADRCSTWLPQLAVSSESTGSGLRQGTALLNAPVALRKRWSRGYGRLASEHEGLFSVHKSGCHWEWVGPGNAQVCVWRPVGLECGALGFSQPKDQREGK